MIPLRLKVKNFLCYRENAPELDLEGVHLACLSGGNGHGKSALLDAITWALWGEARGKQQDELVHTGQAEMRVELEFMARDARYRVERRYAMKGHRKNASTALLLQIRNEGNWVAMPGNTMRETEARVEALIGMDYRTFINSAFLLQGRADEFTSALPSERKEVLARILELDMYDRLEERAKNEVRRREHQAAVFASDLTRLHTEAAREAELKDGLATLETDLREASAKLSEAVKGRDAAAAQVEGLRQAREEADRLDRELPMRQRELEQLRGQVGTLEDRLRGYEALIVRQQAIVATFARLQAARAHAEALSAKLTRLNELNAEREPLAREVASAEARLQQQVAELRERIGRDLAPKAATLPSLEAELAAAQGRVAELTAQEEAAAQRRNAQQAHLAALATALSKLRQRQQGLANTLTRQGALMREREPLALAVERARAQLVARKEALTTDIVRLEALAAETEAREAAVTKAQAELESLTQRQMTLAEERRSQVRDAELRAEQVRSSVERLRSQEQDLRESLRFLEGHQDTDAQCPLCQSELGHDGRERLAARYTSDIEAALASQRDRALALREAEAQAVDARAQLPRYEAMLARPRNDQVQRIAALSQAVKESKQAGVDLAAGRRMLADVAMRLEQGKFAPEEQAKVAAIDSQLAGLAYSTEDHARLNREVRQAETQHVQDQHAADEATQREAATVRDAHNARTRADLLVLQVQGAEAAVTTLREHQERLSSTERTLREGDFARGARQSLARVEADIATLGYDPTAHRAAGDGVRTLVGSEEEHRALNEATRELPAAKADVATFTSMLAVRTEEALALQRRRSALSGQAETFPALRATLERLTAECRLLDMRREDLVRRHGAAEDAVLRAQQAGRESLEKERAARRVLDEQGLFGDLVHAFGKNGVQAVLIDQVLPQIEDEVNGLLSRMTDGRMSLKLQLEAKAKGREELQVLIGDELASARSYELFSGGEAFRINLALRIALSKVLARRSGAPLPTLFIDEGFGTQDTQGRERIMDVIRAVQQDFQCIVVITHLEELKELFPVRVEVEKLAQGSTFRVVWAE